MDLSPLSVVKQTIVWSCRVTALSSPDTQNMHYNMQGEFCAGIGWRGWTGIHSVMCSDHTEPACSRCRSLQFPLVNIWRCGELRPRVSFNYSTGLFHVVHTWVQVFLRGRGCLWAFFGFTATAAARAPKVSLTVNPSDPPTNTDCCCRMMLWCHHWIIVPTPPSSGALSELQERLTRCPVHYRRG